MAAVTESTYAVKVGLDAAIDAVIAADDDPGAIENHWGSPPPSYGREMFCLMNISADLEVATMGTKRTRDETIRAQVNVIVFRQGSTAQKDSCDRAYELLAALERHIRVTDPTLGGACWQCLLTLVDETGDTAPPDRPAGRYTEIVAEFTARVRITE